MMRLNKDYVWPVIGLAAVGFSVWLLLHQLRDISVDDIIDSLNAIPVHGWILSALATLSRLTLSAITSVHRFSPARWCVTGPTAPKDSMLRR
jgi:uncharacterized membrane protein YbhN (UPF0104 family)